MVQVFIESQQCGSNKQAAQNTATKASCKGRAALATRFAHPGLAGVGLEPGSSSGPPAVHKSPLAGSERIVTAGTVTDWAWRLLVLRLPL